jgi:hypothetical protein
MRIRRMSRTLTVALVAGQWLAGCSSGRETDPAGSSRPNPSGETLYLLRANGILCITYPCFGIDAVPEDAPEQPEVVSDVDFSALGLSAATRDSLLAEVMGGGGVTAAGRFKIVHDAGPAGDGRVFQATSVKGLERGGG